MSNFNPIENEINFIDNFVNLLKTLDENEFNNMNISVLESIISILENYRISSSEIYKKIKSIICKKNETLINNEIDKEINENSKKKNKTEFNLNK